MEGLAPRVIVVALGAGALGGADVLRILLDFAGRSPLVDIAICVLVIAMLTVQLLGAMLLARFIRKPRAQAGAPGALATDCFAKMTLAVSVGVAFLLTACLVVASGGLGSARLMFDVAGKGPVITVLVVGAAGSLPCIVLPLLRAFRETGDADGAAPGARVAKAFRMVYYYIGLPVAACILHNALRFLPGVNSVFVGVAAFTVFGISRNAAGAPGAATEAGRFGKLTQIASLVVVSFALVGLLFVVPDAHALRGSKSGGGKHACSA